MEKKDSKKLSGIGKVLGVILLVAAYVISRCTGHPL
jgi:hypothetical protein